MTTDWEAVLRIANVILGVLAGVSVLLVVLVRKPSRPEAMGMVGGALVCFAVALGSLGRLLGWQGELFLPFMTAALAYVAGGRLVQLVTYKRKERD